MFKHNSDRISTGVIDLRQFWHKDENLDQFRVSVQPDSVDQILFTKTANKFRREVLFSVGLPTDIHDKTRTICARSRECPAKKTGH